MAHPEQVEKRLMSLHSLLRNISKYWSIDCKVLHWWSWLARGYKCILRSCFSLNSMPCSRYPFIEHQKGWKMLWVIIVPEYPSFIGYLSHFCSGKSNGESNMNIRSRAHTVNVKVDCFFAKKLSQNFVDITKFYTCIHICRHLYRSVCMCVCIYASTAAILCLINHYGPIKPQLLMSLK